MQCARRGQYRNSRGQAEPLAFKNAHLKKHFLRKLKHDAQANRLVTKAALNFLSAQFLKKNQESKVRTVT